MTARTICGGQLMEPDSMSHCPAGNHRAWSCECLYVSFDVVQSKIQKTVCLYWFSSILVFIFDLLL